MVQSTTNGKILELVDVERDIAKALANSPPPRDHHRMDVAPSCLPGHRHRGTPGPRRANRPQCIGIGRAGTHAYPRSGAWIAGGVAPLRAETLVVRMTPVSLE